MKEKAQVDAKTKAVFDRKGYQVEYKISEGAFGQVYTARNVKRNETDAVKVMDLGKLSENFKSKFLTREIMTLIKVRHPNVLRIYDIFRSAQHVYIFMEFAPNGTLSTQVKNAPDGFLTESKSKFWFRQCVEALECMHVQHKICHRDIKVDNVLLDNDMNAKLSDFGFAKEVPVNGNGGQGSGGGGGTGHFALSTTFCGTEPYFAPEIVMHKAYDPFSADVWAMGVLLYVMLNGRFPFHFREMHKNRDVMLKEQRNHGYEFRPEAAGKLSAEVKDALARMMTFESEKRPNIQSVRKFPWLR